MPAQPPAQQADEQVQATLHGAIQILLACSLLQAKLYNAFDSHVAQMQTQLYASTRQNHSCHCIPDRQARPCHKSSHHAPLGTAGLAACLLEDACTQRCP